jgi:hypothetical protein
MNPTELELIKVRAELADLKMKIQLAHWNICERCFNQRTKLCCFCSEFICEKCDSEKTIYKCECKWRCHTECDKSNEFYCRCESEIKRCYNCCPERKCPIFA